MSIALSPLQLRRLRLQNQLLSESSRSASAAEVVRRLCALQSQEWPSAQLAIHARARGITRADVIQAREVERAFVLTWSLRGTLHLVAAEDIRWQLALCGAGAIRGARRRYQQLGLTEELRERGLREMEAILGHDGPLIRSALAERLGARGIPVEGQAIHHLVRFAALRGLICLGPEIDGDLTYVLLDDWLPAGRTIRKPTNPAAELARRYLRAFAPATAEDFARWSGLGKRVIKAAWGAIAGDCVTVAIPDGEAQMLKTQLEQLDAGTPEAVVRFLPRYDNYLLGYASRAFMVADEYAKQAHPGGGLIRACVIIDGEAKAHWKLEKRRAAIRLVVEPYENLSGAEAALMEAEAGSLGGFLDSKLELRIENA